MTKLATALALTISAVAYAQASSGPDAKSTAAGAAVAPLKATGAPTKASVPTAHVYQSGFSQRIYPGGFRQFSRTAWMHPIYQGGFARIMPNGLPDIPRDVVGQVRSDIAPGDPKRFLKQGNTFDTTLPVSRQMMPDPGPAVRSGPSFRENPVSAPMANPAAVPMAAACPDPNQRTTGAPARRPDQKFAQPDQRFNTDRLREQLQSGDNAAAVRSIERARVEAAAREKARNDCGNCCDKSAAERREDAHERTREFGLGMDPDHQPVQASIEKPATAAIDPDAFSDPDMVGREPAHAVDLLRAHLKETPEDFRGARMLSVALLLTKHAPEAAEVLVEAYQSDPLLCKEPIDTKQLGLDAARVNNLVKTAGDAARQSNSPKTWLLAAAIYQAQGSRPLALSSLEKARMAGLNADVGDWFLAELKKPDPAGQVATAAKP